VAQDELMQDCREAADMIPKLVQGVKESLAHPDHPSAQLNLINAAENFLLVRNQLVTVSHS
jgi:talin